MDRRQARKIGYLVLADYIHASLEDNGSVELSDFYADYGVTDDADVSRVERAISGIEISLRNRGNAMTATGGGGTRFNFTKQTVVNPQNLITVPPVVQSVQGVTNVGNRIPVSDSQLEAMVTGEIDTRTQAGESFTAFDITKALRAANPTLAIRHENGVREIVHDIMLGVSGYDVAGKDFGSFQAQEYFPAQTPSSLPTPPALSGGGLTSLLLSSN